MWSKSFATIQRSGIKIAVTGLITEQRFARNLANDKENTWSEVRSTEEQSVLKHHHNGSEKFLWLRREGLHDYYGDALYSSVIYASILMFSEHVLYIR